MRLSTGWRLAAYEIVSAIGAGGMGEVYRARDTKLNRDVALKVLPDAFTHDSDRLARFRREAQVLASLNHPHIGAIYGFEDSGEIHALVLELVEGDTLADRIARGLIPLEDALPIARQIGAALEAAHDQGIIHRDLKPSNIKITPDGVVKVLDFGLAKLAHPEVAAGRADLTVSPTMTSPALMTSVGVLLGTAAYMSPEQAKGREADKRSDIWAFGCVLYEMLTGRRAFDGDDMTDVLGAVVRLEPNWEALPSDLPQPVRTLLHRCLVKDRRTRIADIAAALFVLDHQTDVAASRSASAAPPHRPSWRSFAALTAGALVVAGLATTFTWVATRPAPPGVVRTMISTSGSAALTIQGSDRDIAITPDGSRVVYRGNNELLVRALNQLEPTVLSGLGAPHGVFISPDGQWVGFFDGTSTIKKVSITGGPPVTVCAVQGVLSGATWGRDGTIIFATNAPATGLQRVPDAGGEPTALTTPDRARGEGDHFWPEFLPGGEGVLFTVTSANRGLENAEVAVLDLRSGAYKILIRGGTHAQYVSTGHLVYSAAQTLRAVAFDPRRLEVVGPTAPVLESVVTKAQGAVDFAVAADGSLVYVPGVKGFFQQTVLSVDRQGRSSPLPGLRLDSYRDVRVSPDCTRLALATENDVWIYDIARAALSRLTTDPARDASPLWTPDGTRVVFTSSRAGHRELFWRPADGSGRDERILPRGSDLVDLQASGWSPDGQLLFMDVPSSLQCVIGQAAIDRSSEAKVLLKGEFCSGYAVISPGGRWMAYQSNSSGQHEIYVERYPELGNRKQISSGGGTLPLWSRDGRELFFLSLDFRQILAAPVELMPSLVVGRPQGVLEFAITQSSRGGRPYDIAPDGRFLIIRSDQAEAVAATAPQIVFVQNWTEDLKRLVPVN